MKTLAAKSMRPTVGWFPTGPQPHATHGRIPSSLQACSAHLRASLILLLFVAYPSTSWPASPDFQRDVAPILATRCAQCHNTRDMKGGLDLTSDDAMRRGGDSGPAVADTPSAESLLLQRVVDGEMPPAAQGKDQRLPREELDVLRSWVDTGALWPPDVELDLYEQTTGDRAGRDWWSLQPIVRPDPPHVQSSRIANPIDRFIWQGLEQHQLTMAPPADKHTLVRRAYFDLLGLPPTPEQAAQFLGDQRPDAWERLVDQLLASPHYGERWARYWLDVVRFAETCGYERDQLKPDIWKYRDWVIQALNDDMPYDQFVTYQLAGDEVTDRNESTVVATGMLRAGTWNDEPNDPADYLYERLEDMVDTTSSAFLGLTVKCARCHDHKFDPIPQSDYYRIASFFWVGHIGQANLGGPNQEQLGFNVFGWTDKGRDAEPFHLLINGDRHRPGEEIDPGFLSAIPSLDHPLSPPTDEHSTTTRRLQFARWITDPLNPLTPRVLVNRLWLHHFGEGIVRTPNNFGFKGDLPSHPELLDWLAAELIAPTAPSHGEATRPTPWTLKRMHKLIMLSNAYQQSSVHPDQAHYESQDALNRWLWRFNRRRLDAEAMHDAMLAVTGQLNPKSGGPSFYPRMSLEALEGLSRKDNDWQESSPHERSRRSVYMMTKRSRILPLMTAFDFCDTTRTCAQRDVTTVPTQALALLNNDFVHEQSLALAQRVLSRDGSDTVERICSVWRLALGRLPDTAEIDAAKSHLQTQQQHFDQTHSTESNASPTELAWASLCHVLLNTNEFMYVD